MNDLFQYVQVVLMLGAYEESLWGLQGLGLGSSLASRKTLTTRWPSLLCRGMMKFENVAPARPCG